MKLYAIRDVLIGFPKTPGVPLVLDVENDEVMRRVVKASCAKGAQPNILNVNPQDKEVWCVGEINQDTGKITPCEPYLVAKCIEFMNVEEVATDEVESV